MLKKLAIGSAVVMLVCLIGSALLAPSAITSTVEMAEQKNAEYRQVRERQVLSAEGIVSVSLRRGYWIDELTVRESTDGQIHVLTDGYERFNTGDTGMQYSVDGEGHLSFYNYSEHQNPWRMFSKESILKGVVALFSNYQGMVVELWIPKGVAFDLTSHVFNSERDLTIVGEVETYRSVDEEELRRQERERLREQQEQEEMRQLEEEEAEELLREQKAQQLLEYSEYITRNYEYFSADPAQTAADFWSQNDGTLQSAALILADYGAVDPKDEAERTRLQTELYDYLHLVAEENLLIVERNRLHRQYEMQQVEKEVFYARDLELDTLEKELRNRRLALDPSVPQAAIRRAEDRLGVNIELSAVLYEEEY